MKFIIHLVLAGMIMVAPVFLSAAESSESVEKLVVQARSAYKNGLYETAARQFSQAFELSGNAAYLYDAAISFQQVSRWDECIGYMERYLELAPISPKRDRARNARDNCSARLNKSQSLSIESRPSGANVRLGNQKSPIVGSTPLTLDLPPGVQRIFIEKDGYTPVIRDVELKKGTPLRLAIDLKELREQGYLFVDSSIAGVTVFLNGQSNRLTPFEKPIPLPTGLYQLHLNRAGYEPFTRQVQVDALTVHHIPVVLKSLDKGTTWRTPVGWVAQALGALSCVGGYVAMGYADRYYNDTDEFKRLAQAERLGYSVGGGLMAVGLALVIADLFYDPIADRDRNPAFGQPFPLPADAVDTKRLEVE